MPALDLQGAAFASGGPGLEIATGDAAHPVTLDYNREVMAIDVDWFEASLFGPGFMGTNPETTSAMPSLQVAGGLTLTKRGGEKMTLTDGREIEVTSLGFVMAEVRGFIGSGDYWGRNPVTGRLDGSVINDSAIGFAIDDLDLASVFMTQLPVGSNTGAGVYVAATASLGSAGIVGIEDSFTAAISNFELDVNLAVNGSGRAIDFSRSTHPRHDALGNVVRDSSGTVVLDAGYAIAGPQNAPTVVLDHNKALLATQGSVDLNLFDLAVLQGDFAFTGDASGILIFVDGTGRIGPANGFRIESNASAFLRLDSNGVVVDATIDVVPIRIGSAVEIAPDTLKLTINSTRSLAEYEVPETLRRPGGLETISVSATPPGGTNPASYVAASGGGTIRLTDAFTLDGQFDIVLSTDISSIVFRRDTRRAGT